MLSGHRSAGPVAIVVVAAWLGEAAPGAPERRGGPGVGWHRAVGRRSPSSAQRTTMRTTGLRLGRILGIEIAADLGVLLFGGLLTYLLATSVLPAREPALGGTAYWSVAAIGTILFLGSLLAHELGHAVVARRNDVEVTGITLWMLGGVAELRSEATSPGAELRIALAGPAMSLLVAATSIGAAVGLDQAGLPGLYVGLLWWLGLVNIVLALFNLVPGAPLDGGRVLAAVLWKIRGDRLAARIGAAVAGRIVALLVIAAGFAEVFVLGSGTGLFTVVVGWFLMTASRMEELRYRGERALGTMPVSEAMISQPHSVRPWTTLADIVAGPLNDVGDSVVPVVDLEGRVAGVITSAQVRRVPAERSATVTAAEVMLPAAHLPTVMPTDRVTAVIDKMRIQSGGLALVLDHGRFVGLLTPDGISRAITSGSARRSTATPEVPTSPVPPPTPPHVPVQHWEEPR